MPAPEELVIAQPPEPSATSKKRKRPKSAEKKGKKKKGADGSKPAKRMTWTNKQRALVFAARGITFHARHLMNDLRVLMPHSKTGSLVYLHFLVTLSSGDCCFSLRLSLTESAVNLITVCRDPFLPFLVKILLTIADCKCSFSDSKLERKEGLYAINEICEMKNCNMSMFFEMRKKLDLFMWLSMVPNGPSARSVPVKYQ